MNRLKCQNYHYYNRMFSCKKELVNTLLAEANETIRQIRQKKLENNRDNRNQACWRLSSIATYVSEPEMKLFQLQANHAWSQLYYLEHQVGDRHPYIQELKALLLA